MSTEYTIVIERDEDGYYVGSVPAMPGCHTQGKSIDQLLERMKEAIEVWLEVAQNA
jgi:predicted RNase H-like HicB family nuclease